MSWRYKGGLGSGALADIGSHLVDVAEFFCGPVGSRPARLRGADGTVMQAADMFAGKASGRRGRRAGVSAQTASPWHQAWVDGGVGWPELPRKSEREAVPVHDSRTPTRVEEAARPVRAASGPAHLYLLTHDDREH